MSGRIILLRHGSTAYNNKKKDGATDSAERIRGWKDIPLDEDGKREAKETARCFQDKGVDRIYTSPLVRARATAEALGKTTKVVLNVSTALLPWNLGDWAGQPVSGVLKNMKEHVESEDKVVPGGESFASFRSRFLGFLVSTLAKAKTSGETVVLVTHSRNFQCAKAWIAAGAHADLAIDVHAMNDYSQESTTGSTIVIAPSA